MADLLSRHVVAKTVRTVTGPLADLATFTEVDNTLATHPARLPSAHSGRRRAATLFRVSGLWAAHRS